MLLLLLLLPCLGFFATGAAAAFAAKRVKVNKYAKFSKADEVRRSLRFSNIDDEASVDADVGDGSQAAAQAEQPPQRSRWEYPDAAEVDQRDPATFGFTEIGIVLGAHGTRGEVKVSSDSDFATERLCEPGLTWLRRPKRRAPREVRLVQGRKGPGTNAYLVTLEGVANREDAAALKGSSLFVRRELRPSLEDDELMLWELEGLDVALAERASDGAAEGTPWEVGAHVGVVTGAIPKVELTGNPDLGNDLLEVALGRKRGGDEEQANASAEDGVQNGVQDDDARDEEGEEGDTIFVPFVSQIVVEIRLDERLILVDPPEGLLELIQPKREERVVIRGLLPAVAASLQQAAEPVGTVYSPSRAGGRDDEPDSEPPSFVEH